MKTETPFYYKTSFFVRLYAIILAVVLILQALIILVQNSEFADLLRMDLQKGVLLDFLNGSLVFPIETMTNFWVAISCAYIGVDRASYFIKTSNCESGQTDFGDPSSNRKIILWSGLLYGVAVLCNMFVDAEFSLTQFAAAFGSSIMLYVAGQKGIKCVKYVDGRLDLNNNGIPDNEEVPQDEEATEQSAEEEVAI